MRIRSVNTGQVREIPWRGGVLTTAFVKTPVPGPVAAGALGLEGDVQADLRVHGGVDKAVYLYPSEHYPHWEEVLGTALEPGALGENLTTEGVLEEAFHVGDELEAGGALLQVAQPRLPCVKLAARHGREDLPRRFTRAALPGFYLRVLRPGPLGPGDAIRVVRRHPEEVGVLRVFRLLTGLEEDPRAERHMAALAPLGRGARDAFRDRTGLRCTVDEATADEGARVAELLRSVGLPTDGFPDDAALVLVAREENRVVGGVALERWGDAALLRSLVVAGPRRGAGVGTALTAAAVARARAGRAASISLLTETAEAFFRGFGFQAVARGELPPPLAGSAELRGACPESAVCMTLPLRG